MNIPVAAVLTGSKCVHPKSMQTCYMYRFGEAQIYKKHPELSECVFICGAFRGLYSSECCMKFYSTKGLNTD